MSGETTYPQFAGYSWENLFPDDYSYNGHPLKLWKGRPAAPAAAPADGENKSTNFNREKNKR